VTSNIVIAPLLPEARGPLSAAVVSALRDGTPASVVRTDAALFGADPFGEDLQLALYTCYELHYRGFDRVDPEWEWEWELLRLRAGMERVFLGAIRREVAGGDDVDAALRRVTAEATEATGVSAHLRDHGEWWQLREYLVHRSIYHLKEADPHAWVIPRLRGQAKASLVAVEYDEFGGGRGDRMHARLFAELMRQTGLDPAYGRYLDMVPAVTLATVNMMSLFGLHRALRGAMVGHFAAAEISTPPTAQRLADALERLGARPSAGVFFTEHVEADAVHEQVLRRDVVGDLLAAEPHLAGDVVLGAQATAMLEDRRSGHLLGAWRAGESSLRAPVLT
jgi:hypothetical protein